ncbi:hypothetical protein AAFF_G00260570 [Aldrovandia affinis]|uniref:Uncharacterized protein n=1 Tax=Aldrovandia affinis TaxID=143900 RepID=A0AAD7RBV6_9TELE|nr:hypothetical protein AAFF_G00260570 [Aldrovandia affinis]
MLGLERQLTSPNGEINGPITTCHRLCASRQAGFTGVVTHGDSASARAQRVTQTNRRRPKTRAGEARRDGRRCARTAGGGHTARTLRDAAESGPFIHERAHV